jgi:hypothetical protein
MNMTVAAVVNGVVYTAGAGALGARCRWFRYRCTSRDMAE